MAFDWTELLKSGMVMFAVIDIVGSIPFLLDIKKKAGDIHAERASLVALGIMLAFLFLGEGVINFLGIDVNSFAVAGSIVMFFMAFEMILVAFFLFCLIAVAILFCLIAVAILLLLGRNSLLAPPFRLLLLWQEILWPIALKQVDCWLLFDLKRLKTK